MAKYLILILSLFLQSCSDSELTEKDFIGTWKSNDGATVELKPNGIAILTQVNLSNVFFNMDVQDPKLDGTGKWGLNKGKSSIEIKCDKYNFDLEIAGQGIFESNPPWDLFVWIGDPDDMNKYKFVKE